MIVIDTESLGTFTSVTNNVALSTLSRTRRDRSLLPVRFRRDGSQIELPSDAIGILGVKPIGDYAAETFSALANGWRKIGVGSSAVYHFDVNLAVPGIEALFSDPSTPTVQQALEITWMAGGYVHTIADPITLTIRNDYIALTEPELMLPPSGNPVFPSYSQLPVIRTDITTLTGGGASALDAILTAEIDLDGNPILYGILVSGGLNWYLLTSGTDAEDPPGIIRPDDFALGTNEKVWKQVS